MTYPATQTFWLERTDNVAWGLRRYADRDRSTCGADSYHDALIYLGVQPAVFSERGTYAAVAAVDHDDPRWPTGCRRCDFIFGVDDRWQTWQEGIYLRPDTGQQYVLHQSAGADGLGAPSAPVGASWDAWWMSDWAKGPDGICLMVRLPNGHDWMVDNEANNCTRPGDRNHKCWVRHGDPRESNVTVDKNGATCAAGAGSILAGDYHGFLVGGVLTAG